MPRKNRRVCLPARQDSLPVWIHVLSHFRLVIALAVGDLAIALAPARKLSVVEIYSQARPVWNPHGAVGEGNAPTAYDFVLGRLPRVVRVAGVAEMWRG